MSLFKFLSPSAACRSLSNPGEFTLRFSFPKDYNDPYELFLVPDQMLESVEERSYYEGLLKQLPQAPVTCFSKRPDSTVMWAHYGQLSSGLCLEIDEDRLFEVIEFGYICDVEYSDAPAYIPASAITFACTTKKNRHTLGLLSVANRSAYFRKRSSWNYEEERRLVVTMSDITVNENVMLGRFPSSALKRIIIGAGAGQEVRDRAMTFARESGVEVMNMTYSRRVVHPIFRQEQKTFFWSEDDFEHQTDCCTRCFEPFDASTGKCSWCEVTDDDLAWTRSSIQTFAFIEFGVMPGLPLLFDGLSPRGRKTQLGNDK